MKLIPKLYPPVSLLLMLLFSSCAVMFVGPYDQVTDLAIQDLTKKTEVMISSVAQGDDSYQHHAAFYREAEGALAAIEIRSGLYPKNSDEIHIIGNLRKAYKNLEKIHKTIGSFRVNEATPVRSLLQSLLHHELSKKRSAGISASSAKTSEGTTAQ